MAFVSAHVRGKLRRGSPVTGVKAALPGEASRAGTARAATRGRRYSRGFRGAWQTLEWEPTMF